MVTPALAKFVAASVMLFASVTAQADVFNMGGTRDPVRGTWTGLASLEMVTVGNPGNTSDDTGYGSVAQPYLIGKYEITNAQWREFLTAKARTSDPYGLYYYNMAELWGGIDRTWSVDHYVYTAKGGDANWDNRPVNYVSFWDAARFCNWLHNGQGNGDTEHGAYENIGNQSTFARQPGAKYFIPTENEWYKSAYYDHDKGGAGVPGYWDYPTMSDDPTVPSNDLTTPDGGNNANFFQGSWTNSSPYYSTVVGEFENSASAYGTFDQGGNLWEWNETAVGESRGKRGGAMDNISYYLNAANPYYNWLASSQTNATGFRVASIPEPDGILLIITGGLCLMIYAWQRRMTL